ncbi:MAG: NACHT domain-containing protein, partial [Candidatus Promineofilum sp.]|nr:NACHT domain-containing protein [Promineifilum sp.]
TMLLQLVSHLLAAAEADDGCPMPAVFALSAYRDNYPLADWLVDQLANNYETPRKLAAQWIDAGRFVPLLDGLDEVAPDLRPACAEAINAFRQQHPGVALLVTARSRDYQTLATRLNLDKAIVLQPLTPEQIDTYLLRRGPRLAGLRQSLAADATLRELAQTPLMLSIMTLAYRRMPEPVSSGDGGEMGGRLLNSTQLFDVYAERMARYRGQEMRFAPSDTIAWLTWLARQLTREGKPTFFLEDMQPSWLAAGDQRRLARSMRLLVFLFLLAGALPASFLFMLFGRWESALAMLLVGLLAAAVPVLTGRFLLRARLPFRRIETVESLDWSWAYGALGLGVGALGGLALGALAGWLDRWSATPWAALLAAAGGALGAAEAGLRPGDLRLRMAPGQGIVQSMLSGTTVLTRVSGLVGVLNAIALSVVMLLDERPVVAAALPWVLWLVLYLGLGFALAYGQLAYYQHARLRRLLYDRGHIAEDYPAFLNQTAERNLLRKVGGGYTFVHALLLQYFGGRG